MKVRRLFLPILIASITLAISSNSPANPSRDNPLWAGDSTLQVRLEADFESLLEKSTTEDEAGIPGRLAYIDSRVGETTLPVTIEVRGHSSRKDCSFPKLELKFEGSAENTVFARTKKVKLGTHCGDQDGWRSPDGRLKNQLAPHREALVYRILEALDVPTFKTRPTRVTYVFTDGSNKKTTRNGFFLETTGSLEKRLGAEEITSDGAANSPRFRSASEASDMNEVALAYLANGLMSNSDFIIPVNASQAKLYPLWNTKAFVRENGRRFIVPYDFDMALFVTDPSTLNNIEFMLEDAKTRALAAFPEAIAHAKEAILSRREEVYRVVRRAELMYPDPKTGELAHDSQGIAAILAYLDEMFLQVESL